jgi:uncharacterized membrane protein YfcA
MTLTILITLFVCSLIQSLFGVGLLLFGTPALMTLCGLSFSTSLSILIPSSLTVNILQIRSAKQFSKANLPSDPLEGLNFKTFFMVITPAIALGMLLLNHFSLDEQIKDGEISWIKIFMSALLLFGLGCRHYKKMNLTIQTYARRHQALWLMFMGLCHAVTNLGGALLTLYMSALYKEPNNKEKLQHGVALGYFIMCASQGIVLAALSQFENISLWWPAPVLASATYLTLGRRGFNLASGQVFHWLLSLFMLTFAGLLAYQAF